jgi:hypothetical protein
LEQHWEGRDFDVMVFGMAIASHGHRRFMPMSLSAPSTSRRGFTRSRTGGLISTITVCGLRLVATKPLVTLIGSSKRAMMP